jgi:hypothetical protein
MLPAATGSAFGTSVSSAIRWNSAFFPGLMNPTVTVMRFLLGSRVDFGFGGRKRGFGGLIIADPLWKAKLTHYHLDGSAGYCNILQKAKLARGMPRPDRVRPAFDSPVTSGRACAGRVRRGRLRWRTRSKGGVKCRTFSRLKRKYVLHLSAHLSP